MATFRALRLHKTDSPAPDVKIEQLTTGDLSTGNVLISNEFSSLNYKDALAVTGKGKIIRDFPMVPGIDAAGVVLESDDPNYHPGEHVILTVMVWGRPTPVECLNKSECRAPIWSERRKH